MRALSATIMRIAFPVLPPSFDASEIIILSSNVARTNFFTFYEVAKFCPQKLKKTLYK